MKAGGPTSTTLDQPLPKFIFIMSMSPSFETPNVSPTTVSHHAAPVRTKQTARKSTGGKAPRKNIVKRRKVSADPPEPDNDIASPPKLPHLPDPPPPKRCTEVEVLQLEEGEIATAATDSEIIYVTDSDDDDSDATREYRTPPRTVTL